MFCWNYLQIVFIGQYVHADPLNVKGFYFNVDHEKIPYKVGEEWDYCITFDCDGCALRNNI